MKTLKLKMKKPLLIALIATVATIGITAGVVFAQDDDENTPTPPEAQQGALLDRVAEIYQENTGVAIDPAALKDAFIQAGEEMRTEALDSHLQALVEQGKITQEQADQFKQWSEARPDMPMPSRPFFRGGLGGHFMGPGGMGFPHPGRLPPGDVTRS